MEDLFDPFSFQGGQNRYTMTPTELEQMLLRILRKSMLHYVFELYAPALVALGE